jgi:hypothetical protein
MTRSVIKDTIAILSDRNCFREFVTKAAIAQRMEGLLKRPTATVVAIDTERKPESKISLKNARKSWLGRVAL